MSNRFEEFQSIWILDTEYRAKSGERNEPVCLCGLDLLSDRRVEIFFDEPCNNPFSYENSLFVGYNASAEWKTFLSLGWTLPHDIVDLYFEYLNQINGLWQGQSLMRDLGSGLSDALAALGLDFISYSEKNEERDYILSLSSYPAEGKRRILDYCWTDVDGTKRLFEKMLPALDMEQALLRGAYSIPVAWIEHNGLPLSPLYFQVAASREPLRSKIAEEVESKYDYRVFSWEKGEPVFKQGKFDDLVERVGLADIWPRTPRGVCSTSDKDAFEPMAKVCTSLEPLRQTVKSLRNLNNFGVAVGTDGRNRAQVRPFGAVTGRNCPRTSEFILSRPHWVRNLIAPASGRAVIYGDIVAAEMGIAADASGDTELIRVYNSGADPYLEFAKSAGALSPDAVRNKSHAPDIERIRTLYKVADLAIKYGIGAPTLALNLGVPVWQAEQIIASHRKTYATYWAWAEAQVKKAYLDGRISTDFGWTMNVDRNTKRNTILNFPQQAACAELLRLTLMIAVERGLGPMLCAPHHDAFYLESREDEADAVVLELESCFREAKGVVLSGRVDLRLSCDTIRFPDHYCDEGGLEIWNIVKSFLGTEVHTGPSAEAGRSQTAPVKVA